MVHGTFRVVHGTPDFQRPLLMHVVSFCHLMKCLAVGTVDCRTQLWDLSSGGRCDGPQHAAGVGRAELAGLPQSRTSLGYIHVVFGPRGAELATE